MSKMRWADSSSDEEDTAIRVPVFQQSSWNDGVVQPLTANVIQKKINVSVPSLVHNRFADDMSTDEDDDLETAVDDDNTLYQSERQETLRQSREATKPNKDEGGTSANVNKKPLSKKEKQALKAKELNDLDIILNEFGISTGDDFLPHSDPATVAPTDESKDEIDHSLLKKKKKKKNKESNNVTDEKINSSILVDDNKKTDALEGSSITKSESTLEEPTEPTLDVASLLRLKVNKKVKEKSVADIASAEAVKEAKAKKEMEARRQKKKNKDKYAFGAPTR